MNNNLKSNRGKQVSPVAAAFQQVTHRNTRCANHGPTLRSKNIYSLIFCWKEYKTYLYTCGEETQGFGSIMCSICKWRNGEWWVMISTMIFPNAFASCAACSLWIPDELFVLFGKQKCGKKGRARIWSMLKNQKTYIILWILHILWKILRKRNLTALYFFLILKPNYFDKSQQVLNSMLQLPEN